ncbi:F0F1 ATP synthase subunit delta [Actinotalea sp. BY-33]|uniref:ATP synthase subunit delta n=1 Tax=Actinotalea soli TaxID=2819234 RepID=A0A939LNP4_9CELL|nr:F0F1 ATP synthase subunit delta [Actinotalea soli]MBO1750853.1 F0F1 ATP synthase subunit delta [Actinotalea soli]
MRGTGQASLDQVAGLFEPVLAQAGPDAAVIGEQLFALVDALDSSGSLRRALSDPARSGDDKAALVTGLLGGKVDGRVTEVVAGLARARWSAEADLVTAVEHLGLDAVLAAAEHAGALAQVEDELFRLDRMLVGQRELRQALTARGADAGQRARLVRTVLEGKVHAFTLQLVERVARAPRGRSVSASLGLVGRLAAARRERLVAAVSVATTLTKAQEARLTGLLEQAYGRPVQLNLSVDPAVIGGMRIQVGSEVVDSTVLARLDDARRRLAG